MNSGMIQNDQAVVWIPQKYDLMKVRILISGHTALGGLRKNTTTRCSLNNRFARETLDVDVETFCESCIHSKFTDSGERVLRPVGHTIHGEMPNEVLHLDFCYIRKSIKGYMYVLIVKDGMSSFIRLYAFEIADADAIAEALIDLCPTFGPAFLIVLPVLLRHSLRFPRHSLTCR